MEDKIWLSKLADQEFYTQGAIAEKLSHFGVNPLDIMSVSVREVKRGLFDRRGLYDVVFNDCSGHPTFTIFAKVSSKEINEPPKWNESRKGALEVQNSLLYQYSHLLFCNQHKLPVVDVVDYYWNHERGYSLLLMRKFTSPTFDIDLLAIEKLKQQYQSRTNGAGKKIENIGLLEGLTSRLLESALEAINQFAVIGTSSAGWTENQGLKINQHPVGYYATKMNYRLKLAILHRLVQLGELDRNNLKDNLDDNLKSFEHVVNHFWKILEPHMSFVEAVHTERDSWAYIQGDEHPHHFYFEANGTTQRGSIDDLGTKAKLLDTSLCMFGSMIRSKAALLSSPLIKLNFGEKERLFYESQIGAYAQTDDLRKDPQRAKSLEGLLPNIRKLNVSEMHKRFNLIYLFELFNRVGLIGRDDLFNDFFINGLDTMFGYRPSIPMLYPYFMEVMKSQGQFNITFNGYNPLVTLKHVKDDLADRLNQISSSRLFSLNGQEADFVEAIKRVFDELESGKLLKSANVEHIHNHTNPPLSDHEGNGTPGFSPVADTQELPGVEPSIVKLK